MGTLLLFVLSLALFPAVLAVLLVGAVLGDAETLEDTSVGSLAELHEPVQAGGLDQVPGRVRAEPQHSGGGVHPERARPQLVLPGHLGQGDPVDEDHVGQPRERRGLIDDRRQEAGPAQRGRPVAVPPGGAVPVPGREHDAALEPRLLARVRLEGQLLVQHAEGLPVIARAQHDRAACGRPARGGGRCPQRCLHRPGRPVVAARRDHHAAGRHRVVGRLRRLVRPDRLPWPSRAVVQQPGRCGPDRGTGADHRGDRCGEPSPCHVSSPPRRGHGRQRRPSLEDGGRRYAEVGEGDPSGARNRPAAPARQLG